MLKLIDHSETVGTSTHKEIMKSYKYELKPTRKHEVILNKTIGTCRHLYNIGLEQRKDAYENDKWSITYSDQQDQLPVLRQKCREFNDVYAQVEQNVIRILDKSMKNFFRRIKGNKEAKNGDYKKPGFPRFKGYGRYDSFTFPQYGYGCHIIDKKGKNDDKGNIIKLSKIGSIKFIKHREIEGIIKIVTIKKEVDKFFVIFITQQYVEIPNPREYYSIEELKQKCVGIDMNLTNLVTISSRNIIEIQQYLRKSEQKLAKHQRRLFKKQRYEKEIIDKRESKKQKKEIKKKIKVNSKNREKERIKIAKIHKHIANQRRNFNHEVSRTLTDTFDLIIFEKLNIQKMMQNHHYAKSIADASWYQIQMFTKYKAEWAGKMVDFVDPKDTTKECSKCHKINEMPIWKRTMECSCGNIEDRDIDASFVIRDRSIIYQDLKRKVTKDKTSRDTISQNSTNRKAIVAIQASGEETSTQSNEQVSSVNQETLSNMKDGNLADTILQAPPFRAG